MGFRDLCRQWNVDIIHYVLFYNPLQYSIHARLIVPEIIEILEYQFQSLCVSLCGFTDICRITLNNFGLLLAQFGASRMNPSNYGDLST